MNKGFKPVNLGRKAMMLSAAFAATLSLAPTAHAETKQATASTQVVRTGTLSNTGDLDFGHVVPGTMTSYLTIPATSNTISTTGGNAIPAGGTVSRGQFVATTLPINVITVQLPTTATLTRIGGGATIEVDQFRHDLTGGITLPLVGTVYNVLNNGTLVINIGARIRVAPGQMQGKYTGTYQVTSNFF